MTDSTEQTDGLAWHVRRGTQRRGPYSSARVRRFVRDGRLQLDDQVSRDGVHWETLGQVDEVVPLQMRRDATADTAVRLDQARRDRARALRSTAVATAVVALVIAATLWVNGGQPPAPADCGAAAAPGVNWRSCGLDGLHAPSANLAGADLSNASLVNAVLSDSDLGGADLAYADLAGAAMSYARLAGARLIGANLRGADLTHADLRDAELAHADLGGALLGGARLQGARLDGAVWSDGRRCGAGSLGACRAERYSGE